MKTFSGKPFFYNKYNRNSLIKVCYRKEIWQETIPQTLNWFVAVHSLDRLYIEVYRLLFLNRECLLDIAIIISVFGKYQAIIVSEPVKILALIGLSPLLQLKLV